MAAIRTDGGDAFLRTKLEVPRLPAAVVRRERLLVLLDKGAALPLTLVSAPAGSGKTAALALWAQEHRPPGDVAWLSLGPDDGERLRFWSAALRALAGASPALRELAIPPGTSVDDFLPGLVDALMGLAAPVTLILDDFHEVGQGRVVADLETIISHAPRSLRLVVSTRMDAPFRLARMRGGGRLAEGRASDLAFTLEETRELSEALELGLSPEGGETLWRRTKGWAAGLRLAAISMRNHPDPQAFVERFAGDDRALTDYLVEEVISRQPSHTLEFLKRTSVVDRLNGDLADAITGASGGDRVLAELVRGGGLVDVLDGAPAWYRYHPLFADVLRIELARTAPEEVPLLHARAARWHAEHGEPLEALRHAVKARDWQLTGAVAGEHWLTEQMEGHGAVMLESLRKVPENDVRTCPELALAKAGLLLESGTTASVDELLAVAWDLADNLPKERHRRLMVSFAATALYRARLSGDVEAALRSVRAMLDEGWETAVASQVRTVTLASLGVAEFWAGRNQDAVRHLQSAVGLARGAGSPYLLSLAQSYAAAAHLQDGRLAEAWHRAEEATELAEAGAWARLPQAAMAYVVQGAACIYWSDLDAAERWVERARSALYGSQDLVGLTFAQLRARLLAARGDALGGLDVLRGAVSTTTAMIPRFLRIWNATLESDLLLALGEVEEARSILLTIADDDSADEASVARGRLELAAGEPESAIRAVATFLANKSEPVQAGARVEAWVIDAMAHDGIRDEDGALQALERAFDLAEPRGFKSPFVRHGAPARSLVQRRIRAGTSHRSFAGDVLATFSDGPGNGQAVGVLLEPLSERELAVLRFLPTMMSNKEIAGEMFVSVNTVKTHLKHVYRKLDVTDRRDAVRRGRELRLLNPGLSDH